MSDVDVLLPWLSEVLPIRAERAVLELGDFEAAEVVDGWVRIPFVGAVLDEDGSLVEATEHPLPLVHREDLEDEVRTRAFLRGWSKAVAARVGSQHEESSASLCAMDVIFMAARSRTVIDDLRLRTEDDFEEAMTRARWLDSAPDVVLYPDLSNLPKPVAQDSAREAALALTPDREAMLAYLRWLDERDDPRGAVGLAMAGPRHADARRAQLLLREHREQLIGPFSLGESADAWWEVAFTWEMGWVDTIVVELSLDPAGPSPRALLDALFSLPATRFVRELVLGVAPEVADFDDVHPLARWSDVLGRGSDALRRLELFRADELMDRPEDEAGLRKRFPRLEQLEISSGARPIACLPHGEA
ncbi:MAG: hypothetical protein JJ863_01010 [Deltaproteobacteria bacterium]|nr:hypothetical protein [Deltaproteobacteria bacterium]